MCCIAESYGSGLCQIDTSSIFHSGLGTSVFARANEVPVALFNLPPIDCKRSVQLPIASPIAGSVQRDNRSEVMCRATVPRSVMHMEVRAYGYVGRQGSPNNYRCALPVRSREAQYPRWLLQHPRAWSQACQLEVNTVAYGSMRDGR